MPPLRLTHFDLCPNLQTIVLDDISEISSGITEAVRSKTDNTVQRLSLRALHQASALQFWSRRTHRLCAPHSRHIIRTVFLVAQRLRCGEYDLPPEMWIAILMWMRRCDLWPRA
eukprot:m.471042 g.471042  ORF g.471042 m.471042 type:complete len:114 (-) comp30517_c0_seq1:409-750(-)